MIVEEDDDNDDSEDDGNDDRRRRDEENEITEGNKTRNKNKFNETFWSITTSTSALHEVPVSTVKSVLYQGIK